jgi:hypothetical protein
MKYNRPEVTDLGFGLYEVQGGKSITQGHDSYDLVATMAAYEADE